ncbi:MAG: hypothetical protein QM674_23725 [Burkholderiaceae bacterium]
MIAEQRAPIEAIAAAEAARARREAIRHLLNDELRPRDAARAAPA